MRRFFKNEKGSIIVISAGAMLCLLIFASAAIDVGCMLTARNQLQCAVDASALAGATGLMVSNSEAISRAITVAGRNDCIKQPVQINSGSVSFLSTNQVRVRANRSLSLFFAKAFGMDYTNISAVAVAELGTIVGTKGMRPWAVPDMGWPTGAPVVLKAGSLGAPATNPSFFYPIDFPPLNRGTPISGASQYRKNISYGSDCRVCIGDEIQVEPGNMIGPTKQGVQELIAQDPGAYWNGTCVVNSQFPGSSSPRIVKIPLYDPGLAPDSGRNSITVIGLGSFFLVGLQGKNVVGVYMEKMTDGTFGNGYSFLRGTRLVL